MKLRHLCQPALVAFAALISLAPLQSGQGAVITKEFGSGSDVTQLLVQFAGTVDSVLYTYHFTYNPGTPFTGADLFIALDAADIDLSLTYTGTATENFFVSEIGYGSYSEPTFAEEGTFYWTSFVSGGKEQAYDSNFNPIPGVFNSVPSGSWSFASSGASGRVVEPGSWDAWVFGEYDGDFNYIGEMPEVAPIPEPGILGLLALGGFVSLFFLRQRSCAKTRA